MQIFKASSYNTFVLPSVSSRSISTAFIFMIFVRKLRLITYMIFDLLNTVKELGLEKKMRLVVNLRLKTSYVVRLSYKLYVPILNKVIVVVEKGKTLGTTRRGCLSPYPLSYFFTQKSMQKVLGRTKSKEFLSLHINLGRSSPQTPRVANKWGLILRTACLLLIVLF